MRPLLSPAFTISTGAVSPVIMLEKLSTGWEKQDALKKRSSIRRYGCFTVICMEIIIHQK